MKKVRALTIEQAERQQQQQIENIKLIAMGK
jgi:hypothetical protein